MINSPSDVFMNFIQGKDPEDPERAEALKKVFTLFKRHNAIICCRGCGKLGITTTDEDDEEVDLSECDNKCFNYVCQECTDSCPKF